MMDEAQFLDEQAAAAALIQAESSPSMMQSTGLPTVVTVAAHANAGIPVQTITSTAASLGLMQQQQGVSATPKLQQIISAAVQTPQIISGSPKLQQIIVANPQQMESPSSKLQQIISAAIQQPGPSGSTQLKRISTTKLTPSQLQQMISANPQIQVVGSVGGNSRMQQIVVTTTAQLQQIVSSTSQFQQMPHVQKSITTSTPLLQGVIASTQAQQGVKTISQVLQSVKTTYSGPQMQHTIKTVSSPQLQQVVKQNVGTQQIRQMPTLSSQVKTIASPQIQSGKPSATVQHMQQVIKTLTPQNQQTIKAVASQLQQSAANVKLSGGNLVPQMKTTLLQQSAKVSAGTQAQQMKPLVSQLQQGLKTQLNMAAQQGKATQQLQGVSASPQFKSQGVTQVTNVKPQGVTATPRLQQMVATPPKKSAPKEKPPPPPKPTNLGDLIGKLSQGSRHVKRFKEDRRNLAKAVKPLNYGAFGSYAPSYDSSFANLSKEESDLINGSYTEFEPSEQIKSIISKDFDYTFTFADNLIDILSGSSAKKIKLEDEIKDEPMEDDVYDCKDGIVSRTEEEEIQALAQLGIDLSHLSALEESIADEGSPEIQKKLEQTTGLIKKLQQMQYERLSVPPHPRLGHTILPPSEAEVSIAVEITENLAEMTKQVPPGALVVDRVCMFK